MNILVCVSKVPDTTAKINFKNNNTELDESGVQFILNPYDDWYALVRALELKEATGGSVTVLNVGNSSNDAIIKKAVSLGADKPIRIDAEDISADFVAAQIANFAKDKNFDIVFCGKETINYNGSQVGAMIAEHLDMPFLSYASHLEMNGNTATVACEIEGGKEIIEVQTPFVVSAAKGLAEQRIASMKGIMAAKRTAIEVVQPIEYNSTSGISSYQLPPAKGSVKLIDPNNMDELVRLLNDEAKAL